MRKAIMPGRNIVITGASDGIGAAAARALSAAGERVVLAGRDAGKACRLAAELGAPAFTADFADLAQVRRLAAQLRAACPRIDILINNAGAIMPRFERTTDGREKTFQVNHLAPFLLTSLLMDVLAASSATVITTASTAASLGHLDLDDLDNARAFDTKKAYATSKLENILFTRELHRRYAGRGISAVAFHPGDVASNFASDTTSNWRFVYRTPLRHIALTSPQKGARELLWLANGIPGTTWTRGLFYAKNKPTTPSPQARDDALAASLWNLSAELAGITASPSENAAPYRR
jgi:NAD(P)-dependent dehydrogenase (short-subunit alcohol dehydrogenase family)